MNARDSEKLSFVLFEKGYKETDNENDADIVIFNTCTVRENANMRLYGHIGQLKKSYMQNKNKIIGICGCMMQEPDEVIKIKEKYPYVKLIFGTHNIDEFSSLIEEVIKNKKRVVKVYDEKIRKDEVIKSKRVYNYKCGVNIMYGCNNFCTYCIVPYVRGREQSRTLESIVNEIKEAVKDGVIEVMLLGQNVNSYNGKFSENNERIIKFPELLNEVCKIEGLKRVRFMTSNPKDFSDELINVIKNNEKVCRHIHLPIQSGSDRILKLMNRHYDKNKYLDIINKLRENIEDMGLTTDIIVGFPTETEEDFNETLDVIKKANFDSVFTFEYSKRTGTKAAEMDGQVPEKVVKDRFSRLLKVVNECAGKNAEKYVGKEVEILVESEDKISGKLTGRMSNNYLVHFNGCNELIGKLMKVKLIVCHTFYFDGEIV